MRIKRRHFLTSLSAVLVSLPMATGARAQQFVDAEAFGLSGADEGDQSAALQMAVDTAVTLQRPLHLGSGSYRLADVTISGPLTMRGTGQTTLRLGSGASILAISDCRDVVLKGLGFDGAGGASGEAGLVAVSNASGVVIRDCRFENATGAGISTHDVQGRIENNQFLDIGDTGIFSTDSRGLEISGNQIARCGNGGIRLWRYESGPDGSRVFRNTISDIDYVGGGNGQNGNGINVFRADGVSISDNHITNCAFSAIRLNATNNSRIVGNHCEDSGEVSIFSEFGFSGSIISNNLIEGGAAGISMTNFDREGRLSLCQGNIVRNLANGSRSNPGVVPYGIAAEADAVVSGNIVERVPGTGIIVGWGPYLRDVLVSDNLVRDCIDGIVVSLAPGAGHARISNNIVSGSTQHAIAGAQWDDVVSADLITDAGSYPGIAIEQNSVI